MDNTTTSATVTLLTALKNAQGEMSNVKFNKENPHFRSSYADLAAVRDATLPILHKHGLTITHTIEHSPVAGWFVRALLAHVESGGLMHSDFPLGDTANKPQQAGSAITYGRRYTWGAICGIATEEDDDGNAAQSASKTVPRKAANDNVAMAFDYVTWGKGLADRIGAARTVPELQAVWNADKDRVGIADKEAPKIWDRLMSLANKREDALRNSVADDTFPAFYDDLDELLRTANSRAALDKVWNANKSATDALSANNFDKCAVLYEKHADRIMGYPDKKAA